MTWLVRVSSPNYSIPPIASQRHDVVPVVGVDAMTSVGLGALRKAALLVHAVSSLGVLIGHRGELRAIVGRHHMEADPSVWQLHPCRFRQTVASAHRTQQAGRAVGDICGLGCDTDPALRFFGLTNCDVRDDGLVRCVVEDDDVVLVFATLLDLPALHAVGRERGLGGVQPSVPAVRVELWRDEELGATLVYTRLRPKAAVDEADAVGALLTVAVAAGVEEITAPTSPLFSRSER